jgi:hypothetical protein
MVAVFFNKVLAIYRLPSYRRIPGTLLFPQSGKFFIFLWDFRECGYEKS